jgi:hypothetical protein
MAARPVVAITESGLAPAEDERVLREAGPDAVRLRASSEDGLVAAHARIPADALIVHGPPVTAASKETGHAEPGSGGHAAIWRGGQHDPGQVIAGSASPGQPATAAGHDTRPARQ